MQMRLAFSIAVHAPAEILLVDEVLAVGDVDFQQKCLNRLTEIKNTGEKIIIFVSHDEKSVTNFCERAMLLDAGRIVFDGTTNKAFSHYYSKQS